MESLPQPSLLQRTIGYIGFALALLWIVTALAEFGIEAAYGKSWVGTLLTSIGHIEFVGFILIAISVLILLVTGVFRIPVRAGAESPFRMSGRALALGALIAVISCAAMVLALLVFASNKAVTDTIANVGPMLLLVGVWLSVMTGMWWDQRRKEKQAMASSSTTSPPQ